MDIPHRRDLLMSGVIVAPPSARLAQHLSRKCNLTHISHRFTARLAPHLSQGLSGKILGPQVDPHLLNPEKVRFGYRFERLQIGMFFIMPGTKGFAISLIRAPESPLTLTRTALPVRVSTNVAATFP